MVGNWWGKMVFRCLLGGIQAQANGVPDWSSIEEIFPMNDYVEMPFDQFLPMLECGLKISRLIAKFRRQLLWFYSHNVAWESIFGEAQCPKIMRWNMWMVFSADFGESIDRRDPLAIFIQIFSARIIFHANPPSNCTCFKPLRIKIRKISNAGHHPPSAVVSNCRCFASPYWFPSVLHMCAA